jgi:SAM-dependent methyltransferase
VNLNEFIPTLFPPPARVLEVGCGDGELARALDAGGYDVLAIDPDAPVGRVFRRTTIEEFEDEGPFDLAVADRMLHHVHPLEPALDKLATLAPLLVVQEFAWERIDAETQAWYEETYRRLAAEGRDLKGPPDLDQWRLDHPGLHPSDVVLAALTERYEQRALEPRPYFYRWLELSEVEAAEQAAIDAGSIRPIGLRWVGASRVAAL